MSTAAHEDLQRYVFTKTDDPEIRARQRQLIEWGLETVPEAREKVKGEGRVEGHLEEARKMLRRVLKARGLTLPADDDARIDACDVLDTLERWVDQATVAASSTDALR
jgi:2-phospho-L-lactate transferase/gluconeogenesis factor (CofD/UPF0052 family)